MSNSRQCSPLLYDNAFDRGMVFSKVGCWLLWWFQRQAIFKDLYVQYAVNFLTLERNHLSSRILIVVKQNFKFSC